MDHFIRNLPAMGNWGMNEFEDRGGFTLRYYAGWLEVVAYHLVGAPREELRQIVAYARSIGLNLFVDVGDPADEMELQDIVALVGPVE